MPSAFYNACNRFSDRVDRCVDPEEVITALHKAVGPTWRVMAIYLVPLDTMRGNRERHPTYSHPDVQTFIDDFWVKFRWNGPSILARHAWRTHRDFSLNDVVRHEKPKPHDLWIFQMFGEHGIGDIRYVSGPEWWYCVFWSPRKNVKMSKEDWRGLRLAGGAAIERIMELDPTPHVPDPKLTDRERTVLRLLRDDGTEKDVAGQLKVSVGTIKTIVARCKKKLRTHSLRETISEAVRYYVVLLVSGSIAIATIAELCDYDDLDCLGSFLS